MNIAYFLTPKQDTAYLYDDYTVRQALEKMRAHGYTRIPVINREGAYVCVIGEGDFLWYLIDLNGPEGVSMARAEGLKLRDIFPLRTTREYKPVRIAATRAEVVRVAMNQNFVPVTDDDGSYIGIVTRRNILKYLTAAGGILSENDSTSGVKKPSEEGDGK